MAWGYFIKYELNTIARRFADQGGTSQTRIPVIVTERVEAGLGNPLPQQIPLLIPIALKSDHQVKLSPGDLTFTCGNHPCLGFVGRDPNPTPVGMGREKFDALGVRLPSAGVTIWRG